MRRAFWLLAIALCACSSEDEPVEEGPTTGTVLLTFNASSVVTDSPTLEDELIGAVYGGLFLTEDVSIVGPRDDAEIQGSIEVADVDLRNDVDVSTQSWESPELEPGSYNFLGFHDVDGDGAETRDPSQGDPVTLATSNVFEIVAGEQTAYTATFDLVY